MIKNIFSTTLFLFSFLGNLSAQKDFVAHISADQEKQIDAVFENWKTNDQPGVSVAILNEGKVVYQKGFGLANLVSKTPITTATSFQVSTLAKQFTVFALLLLEADGTLSLDDDIRKYVPEVPDLGQTVTLRNLINQNSGLHGYYVLKDLAGWKDEDSFTHQDAMHLISTQKKLNFNPGEDFSYVNTGFTIIAEAIQKITGKSLATFSKERIFDPLQMTNSYFIENRRIINPNQAEAYQPVDQKFQKVISNSLNFGPVNLYTSVADMSKWVLNMQNPTVGTKAMMTLLDSPVQLNNGQFYNEPQGILTIGQEYIHKGHGIEEIYQTGYFAGGFDCSIFRFKGEGFTAIVMSNGGLGYNGNLAMQTANIFLEKKFNDPPIVDIKNIKTVKLNNKKLENYCGHYWNKDRSYARRIYLKNDTLRYDRIGANRESPIVPIGESTFQMLGTGETKLILNFDKKNNQKMMTIKIDESNPSAFVHYDLANYSEDDLSAFTGSFHCEELGSSYQFKIQNGQLTATHLRAPMAVFSPLGKDHFAANQWHFGSIEFVRDRHDEVTGFYLKTNRVRNLWFWKQKLKQEH